jgi:general secretion pathway protein E
MSDELHIMTADSLSHIPFEFARDHCFLPQPTSSLPLPCFAISASPTPASDNLSLLLDAPLSLVASHEDDIRATIIRSYQDQMASSAALHTVPDGAELSPDMSRDLAALSDRDLLASHDKPPVAKLVDALLFDALQKGASDLHIHPYPDKLIIRYRIDGVLHNVHTPDPSLFDQLVGRVKVLAGMDVAEKRLPQDGRTSVTIGGGKATSGRQIDLRVSTLPTTCGERVVIRLLEQTARLKHLSELGMPQTMEGAFRAATGRSHGLILVTGPTGSGKTTTLYSVLAGMEAGSKNILTLEDPVEYQLEGISQTQVATRKGMTFLSALRHVLRQDPDVILVGEVRDEPTARMVIQSAMTGHLVLTTLHTNSAAGAVARLADLGIEPYLIASSLIGVLAQRLVRKACPTCKAAVPPNTCWACNGTGYSGRIGIYEWLPATAAVQEQLQKSANASDIEAVAVGEGMSTLLEQGKAMVAHGTSTLAELQRVLGEKGDE